jgi:enoyl-CoA hydratase/carnithine racemase
MLGFLALLERCMTALYLYPGPTVAAIEGHAIAGGCVIALCCDHRVAIDASHVRIGLNEVALGVRFPPRIMSLVRARVPLHHQTEVVLGAGLFSPAEALQLGLVDETVPDVEGGALAIAKKRCEALAKHPPEAYALAKADLRGTAESLCPSEVHDAALRTAAAVWTSAPVKEHLQAVLRR